MASGRVTFRRVITLALLAGVGYAIYAHRSWWSDFGRLSVTGFFLLSLLSIALWVLGGFIFRTLYRPLGLRIPLTESAAIALVTSLGNYVPMVQGGAIFRGMHLKRRYGFSYTGFAASLGTMFVVNFIVYAFLGVLALLLLYVTRGVFSWEVTTAQIGLLVLSASFYSVILVPQGANALTRLKIMRFIQASVVLHRDARFFFEISAAFVIGAILQATQLYVAYSTLGYSASFWFCLAAIPLTIAVSLLGIAPGGIGLTEGVIGFTSSALGFGLQEGAVAATLTRAVTLCWLLPLGVASFFWLSRLKGSPELLEAKAASPLGPQDAHLSVACSNPMDTTRD